MRLIGLTHGVVLLGCLAGCGPGGIQDGGGSDGVSDEGNAPVTCTATACETKCETTEAHDGFEGGVCECERARRPEGYVTCELPDPCGTDRVCMVQAIRYGIPGLYALEGPVVDSVVHMAIEVFGPGRARAYQSGWWHGCCGAAIEDFGIYHHPQALAAADHPQWAECIEAAASQVDGLPTCLFPYELFAGSCEGPLTECPTLPEPPGPDAPCEESCPMAGDGVCDEDSGTGLCPAGCDPVDCA